MPLRLLIINFKFYCIKILLQLNETVQLIIMKQTIYHYVVKVNFEKFLLLLVQTRI